MMISCLWTLLTSCRTALCTGRTNSDYGFIRHRSGQRCCVCGCGQNYRSAAWKASPPPGFENISIIKTRGTIYPGLIELHNHLSYNILKLWDVPKSYTNRDQWSGTPTYQKLISGPMKVLSQTPGYLPAIVRYVECKCLLSGVTTSQGIALYSNQGIVRYYRGMYAMWNRQMMLIFRKQIQGSQMWMLRMQTGSFHACNAARVCFCI